MRRRALLAGAGAAVLLTGCSRGASTGGAAADTSPPGTVSPGPVGRLPVASWGLVGGFLAPQYVAIRPYRLAVYPDGRAVADARYQLALPAKDRDALVDGLVERLADGTAGRRVPNRPMIADVPSTRIVVRSGTHTYSVTADSDDESRKAYPPQFYEAVDLLTAVYRGVVAGGAPYTAARVRLVGTPSTASPGVAPWPSGVPVPGPAQAGGVLVEDLDGTAAARALTAFPLAYDVRQPWRAYTTPGGAVVSAAVRYLLPDE